MNLMDNNTHSVLRGDSLGSLVSIILIVIEEEIKEKKTKKKRLYYADDLLLVAESEIAP